MAGGSLRLFVAAYPPEAAASAMLSALAQLDPPPDVHHRVVPLEQIHLTLQFIGPTSVKELPDVIESVQRSASGIESFELMPRRLVTFPERGPVRLIAMETDSPPGILELQRRLAQRLARNVRKKAGDRFRPHVTLMRFTGAAHPVRVDAPVALTPFAVNEVVLVKSVLAPEGARHDAVERVQLQGV